MKALEIRNLLITEYGRCFLGGEISKKNPYTLHHIIPVRNSGKTILENGALLGHLQHSMLNEIELDDKKLVKHMNEYFIYFKESKDLQALYAMKNIVEYRILEMGFEVKEEHKIYVLKRRY